MLFLEVVYLFLLFGFGFCVFVCLFWGQNLVVYPGWTWTHYVAQSGLKLRILLPSCMIVGMCHYILTLGPLLRRENWGGELLYRPIYSWPHSQAIPELGHDFYLEPCVLCQTASCIRGPDRRNACISPFLCFCEHHLPAIGFWWLEMSQSHLLTGMGLGEQTTMDVTGYALLMDQDYFHLAAHALRIVNMLTGPLGQSIFIKELWKI